MKTLLGLRRPSLLGVALLTLALVTGCGGEKAEKVDLDAQVAGLSGDSDAKIAALAEISKAGPAAVGLLSKVQPLLKDEDPTVQRTAVFALGTMGPAAKAAVPELKALLTTEDRDLLTAAANALRAIDPTALPGFKVENTAPEGGGESE
ncbi:MAG: HEAT repeat domain-containing protein [Limisphaerales bacterium]